MTPEPTAPDAIETTVAEIRALSAEILSLSTRPELPALGQAILRRGELIQQLQQAKLSALPAETQVRLRESLEASRDMDAAIEKNLAAFQSTVDEQLKSCREAHQLLNKYKVGGPEATGHKSEEA